ncbi:hypothetical protein [Salinarimonas sp.]|uniref:hypothetical protein n=1 Tax=Salinarimonas sp. TaxID=2766526 RepID=UPI00391C8016
MNRVGILAAILGVTCLVALPGSAQNFNRNPAFGTHDLAAGFEPDPYRIDVRAGGSRDASTLGSACSGSIADAPDVRINYRAGDFPLSFTVRSRVDTTLVVNDPNGRWYCDDDSAGDLDPMLRFEKPLSGQYDVWIGHFDGGSGRPAQLIVTEY